MQKTTTEEEEFDILRTYILACTDLPKESRAIHAALHGLDTEMKRMERDAKLKRKFTQNSTTTKAITTAIKMDNEKAHSTERTAVGAASAANKAHSTANDDDDELMEWQDVEATNKEATGSSLLGTQLAQMAVVTMAQHGTAVTTPLAAISLALHAALCTNVLGFRCTGIPDTTTSKGFAAPIRELPKSQFLPSKWDANATEIRLRYRKAAVGSVALCVVHNGNVQVSMTPTNTNEPPSESLTFVMDDHINLASFKKAKNKETPVLPALHYKALAALLTNFCNTFDLGSIHEVDSNSIADQQLPYIDSTVVLPRPPSAPLRMPPTNNNDPLRIPSRRNVPPVGGDPMPYNPYDTPTIQVFQPGGMRGDFAGDLLSPGGDFMGSGGGNLMGPGHPMFTGDPSSPMIPGSGFGMRPRFDPLGPPGGPQDPYQPPGRRGPRPPPGGLGEPNPDHARPPNNLGNNMFM